MKHVAVINQHIRLKGFAEGGADLRCPGEILLAGCDGRIGTADVGLSARQLDEGAGAADVVIMTVRVNNPAQVLRLEPQPVDAVQNQVAALRQAGINHQKPVSGINDVRGGRAGSHKVKVAKDLHGFNIPQPGTLHADFAEDRKTVEGIASHRHISISLFI